MDSTEVPLPGHTPTVEMERDSTEDCCGMATGKPFGRPIAWAMRVIRRVNGCGVENVMRRPGPVVLGEKRVDFVRLLAVSIEDEGEGLMTLRVCGRDAGWKVGVGRG